MVRYPEIERRLTEGFLEFDLSIEKESSATSVGENLQTEILLFYLCLAAKGFPILGIFGFL